jgi:hypothetical protein
MFSSPERSAHQAKAGVRLDLSERTNLTFGGSHEQDEIGLTSNPPFLPGDTY